MNIDLVWYFDKAKDIQPFYRDGVKAAMEVIEKRGHNVRWHLGTDVTIPEDSDFILNWDNSTSEFIPQMQRYPQRKGLILTTDLGLDIDSLRHYDVVFPEAQPVLDKIKPHGIRAIKAFGTDTNFFKPKDFPKYYDVFYPATFSPWKRQDLFANMYKGRGLCVGTIQPDGADIYDHVVSMGTQVIVGYLPVEFIRDLYAMSNMVHVTGYEGSGRTMIEAMSMGIKPLADPSNHKCISYILELKASGLSPREFILKNYSEEVYADQLLKGIENA